MVKFFKTNELEITSWEKINWGIVYRTLTDFYILIFNAKKNGDYDSLYRWQKVLFYSQANLLFSINSVTEFCFTRSLYKLNKFLVKNNQQRWNLYLLFINFTPKDWLILIKSKTNSRFNSIFGIKGLIIQNMLINVFKPELDLNFDLNLIKLNSFKSSLSYFYLAFCCYPTKKWVLTMTFDFSPSSKLVYLIRELFQDSPFYIFFEVMIKNDLKSFLNILHSDLVDISLKSFLEKKTIFPLLLDLLLYKFEKSFVLEAFALQPFSFFRYNNVIFIASSLRIFCEKIKLNLDQMVLSNKNFGFKTFVKLENRALHFKS